MAMIVSRWAIHILFFVFIVCPAIAGERDTADDFSVAAEIDRLEQAGDYDQAIRVAQTALTAAEKKSGAKGLPVGKASLALARLYVTKEKNVNAAPIIKQAAEILDAIDDREHPEVADVLTELALIYQMQGRHTEAIPVYKRALIILNRETDKIKQHAQSISGRAKEPHKELETAPAVAAPAERPSTDIAQNAAKDNELEHQQAIQEEPKPQDIREAEAKVEQSPLSVAESKDPEPEKVYGDQTAKIDAEKNRGELEGQLTQPNTPDAPHSKNPAFAWIDRRVAEPSTQSSEFMEGLDIVYYRKTADGGKIVDALNTKRIQYQVVKSQTSKRYPSNAIACGPDTPVDALKYLAHTMIDSGIPLKGVVQFKNPKQKKQRLEIFTLMKESEETEAIDTPPLTHEQIDRMPSCPQNMQNAQN
jgi:tetratricopeptide (TPR) repeat protein